VLSNHAPNKVVLVSDSCRTTVKTVTA